MITSRDSGGVSRAKNVEIPQLIADRVAFENSARTVQGFNTLEGDYLVLSYGKKVAILNRDGSVWRTKGHVYDGHRKLIENALTLVIV